MSATNFAALTDHEKKIWSMQFWNKARNMQFLNKFMGTSEDSLIQRITELKKSEKGARAVITLVNDLEGDGRAGDRQLAGYEEALTSEEQVVQIDQLRHANRNRGRMSDQRTIVNFREQSRNKLAYWMADRTDQMAFLTMSGVSYNMHTNGKVRVGSDLPLLEFAADVTAPTAGRYFSVDVNGGLTTNANTNASFVAGSNVGWATLVNLKAYAKEHYIRPIRSSGGIDFYHIFMTPSGMAKLRLDADYMANVREAGKRGAGNELFKGTDTVFVDGMAISEYRHVYNTKGATSGAGKWGPGANIEGQRMLFCGAQSMGYADIAMPTWVEEDRDFENINAISTGKICGFLKPRFEGKEMGGLSSGVLEDFGVICVDSAI